METKLQSFKVPELKALLSAAGLSVSGNKPDLIQRLIDNPAATASLRGEESTSVPTPTSAATPTPAPVPTTSTTTTTTTATTVDTPSTGTTTTIANTASAASAGGAGGAGGEKMENKNGATGAGVEPDSNPVQLQQDTSQEQRRQELIIELEKRKARAAKFGQPLGEAERKLERAIKFGLDPTDQTNLAKLSQALGTPTSNHTHSNIKTPTAPTAKPASKERKSNKVDKSNAVPIESEEQKQQRLAQQQQEKEKALKRAQRFGLVPNASNNQQSQDELERKRKRQQRFNSTVQGETDEKKVKT